LKREGKARFVGMSCYPLGLLRQAIERCNLDVVISYAHYSLQNTRLLAELMPVAEEHGVGVINASPLSLGLLTNQGPPPWHPAPPEIKETCRKAVEFCRARGGDVAFLGMQFALAAPRVASTLTGTAKRAELEVNLRALSEPIDLGLLTDVLGVLDPVRDRTWPNGNWKG
jgi:L-galactose dehydrogenase